MVTTAQLAFGQMTVKSGSVTRAITTPGFQVVAAILTAPPSRPAQARPEGGPGDSLSGLEGPGGDNTDVGNNFVYGGRFLSQPLHRIQF